MTEMNTEMDAVMNQGRGMLVFMGILCIVLGIVAISSPFFAGAAVAVMVGIMLLVAGIMEMVHAFQSINWKGRSLALLKNGFG